MRGAPVLTHEEARHPFRQSLPRHVFRPAPDATSQARSAPDEDKDWKLFVLSFAAFFTVAYTFIV
ncbi:hypothetical protein M2341_002411 [Sphingobium sp. B7D2B]|uniref:hypothetical protein n=1 Tax=Sphingobium sp. B7D2B TaxID=2940583 RepID=UPI0022246CBE|nr:hypothetical protein [Sphingobium sp. B7D2B]MCW2366964.1 hypothetical protein [Sphingobium sp. B7D2B]